MKIPVVRKGTIAILIREGTSESFRDIEASIRGPFAVHHPPPEEPAFPQSWTVTHCPTGRAVVKGLLTRRAALILVERMLAVKGFWYFTDMGKWNTGHKMQARAVLQEFLKEHTRSKSSISSNTT